MKPNSLLTDYFFIDFDWLSRATYLNFILASYIQLDFHLLSNCPILPVQLQLLVFGQVKADIFGVTTKLRNKHGL